MHRHRLHFTFATLVLIFAIGNDAAAQAQAPPAQQGQQGQAAEIERLRRELDAVRQQQQQQQGQPLLVVPSMAPPPAPAAVRIGAELSRAELDPLLQRVERSSGKRFLVDPRLGSSLYLGTVDEDDVTYPVLLAILRANGFAAFESAGFVNVVPDANIRFHETRIVQTDDASIPADEFVTRVLATTNIQAVMLVPMLRPLMPQAAHLSAHTESNQLVLMDRYANIQRITAIVRALDVAAPARN